MNLIDKADCFATIEILESGKRVNATALRRLALGLIKDCTPYLGRHVVVEQEFTEFVDTHRAKPDKKPEASA